MESTLEKLASGIEALECYSIFEVIEALETLLIYAQK